MLPWTTVFERFGFCLMYLRDPMFSFGWSFSFSLGNFHCGIGVNPDFIGEPL